MAFQQQGGGMNGGPGAQQEHHAPLGSEYTLQGVMRFLQIEWHNHERARNAWDIERAELKVKLAKMNGEWRAAKRMNEQLDKQIRMLEIALRKEREKSKLGNGRPATPDVKEQDVKSEKDLESHRKGSVREKAIVDPEEMPEEEKHREVYVDNTTKFLKNCMKEITYLLTPPVHPPPPQVLPNGNYTALPDPPSVEEIYARSEEEKAKLRPRENINALPMSARLLSDPTHAAATSLPQSSNQLSGGGADMRYRDYASTSMPHSDQLHQTSAQYASAPYEDQIERITHTFDTRGRAIPAPGDASQGVRQTLQQPESDGWTFDEETSIPPEPPQPDAPVPRRPDTDLFPSAANPTSMIPKSPPRALSAQHRRKSSGSQSMSRRRSSQGKAEGQDASVFDAASDPSQFKVKFALRGHLDVVRSVVFTGGGSPSEPEVCTAGDDGMVKRWIIPASYQNFSAPNTVPDLDIQAYFTHRGHDGIVTSLATCSANTVFSTGGRVQGDGWIFSGGQDATIRVWERGRVDPKATLEGHTDAVWSVCVLPATLGMVFGPQSSNFGGPDRLLLVSGSADGTVKVWAVSAPPQTSSPATGSRRGVGGSRRHSVTSGSNFPSSPQPTVASPVVFSYTLVHSIERAANGEIKPSPTSICPLSPSGETFVVSYTDSSVLVFDTRSGEEVIGMASNETYDGTLGTSINTVVATSLGLEGAGTSAIDAARGLETEEIGAGATGSREGVEGMVISGHEDRFVRFFDANSGEYSLARSTRAHKSDAKFCAPGQCTYTMLAHPSAISALSLSKDGREAVSAGHDASIRFWSLEKRICTQDIVSHRAMRGEGVCDVAWSQDGRLVISAGGDGVVKVFAR